MNNGFTLTNPWLQWQQTLVDETITNLGRMAHIPTIFRRAQQIRKGVTPSEVVYEEDRLKVRHYVTDTKPKYRTPLVFVYALVNRPYILDLKKGRSVVANFVERGFDTYLDDYINGYIRNITDFLCERSAVKQVNILAYCMGGTMSAMFTALHPNRVAN